MSRSAGFGQVVPPGPRVCPPQAIRESPPASDAPTLVSKPDEGRPVAPSADSLRRRDHDSQKTLCISYALIPALEAILIEALEPRQNRKRGDDLGAVEYIQHEDPEIQKKKVKQTLETALSKL